MRPVRVVDDGGGEDTTVVEDGVGDVHRALVVRVRVTASLGRDATRVGPWKRSSASKTPSTRSTIWTNSGDPPHSGGHIAEHLMGGRDGRSPLRGEAQRRPPRRLRW